MKNCKTLVRSLALGGALLVGASHVACADEECAPERQRTNERLAVFHLVLLR